MRVAIINGPNLNLLGTRKPEVYGAESFEDFLDRLRGLYPDVALDYYQTNHEGRIIDLIHEIGYGSWHGIILNAGGYTHTSVAIRDAIEAIPLPVVDVHISDIYNREPFRSVNLLADVCVRSIVGEGLDGYVRALDAILAVE